MINSMSYVCQQDMVSVKNYASVLSVPSPAEAVCVCTHAAPLLSVLLLSMADGVFGSVFVPPHGEEAVLLKRY